MNNSKIISACLLLIIFSACSTSSINKKGESEHDPIKPYVDNPKYWQYKGEPVLLLGGTDDDNLFQMIGLEGHLDELAACGGNYIRNTMSFRDSGNVMPYLQLQDGKYDLEDWGEEYWQYFANMLKWTHERDIIVQIEVWDRFDYSQQFWDKNPFRPENNVNFELIDSLFDADYPNHPSADRQPFFHSIPGMPLYKPVLDRIRAYQERYIDKMLSYSLEYGHVLYCMNNETTTPVEWGNYWIDYIRKKANEKGMEIYLTDMYDDFYKVSSCEECKELIAQSDYYTFIDISQINSRNFGQAHWDTLQRILNLRDQYELRPVNNTKVYGGMNSSWGSGTAEDGVERFFRNTIGGCASVRHHRPPYGNGLNNKARASIQSIRNIEKYVSFWDISPQMDLLSNSKPNEAYIAGNFGEKYVLYFPQGGNVTVDLGSNNSIYMMQWIEVSSGEEKEEGQTLQGGGKVEIAAPGDDGWFAVLIKSS